MPSDYLDPFRLQLTLARLGLSQAEAAERLGMKLAQLRDVLAGRAPQPKGFGERVEGLGLEEEP
jgi:transcriptional regulator with XRE-family HTH domain